MDTVLARTLPNFADAPPPAPAPEEPDFSGAWFRPIAVAPTPVTAAPVASEIEPFAPRGAARPVEDREALVATAVARGYEQGRAEAMAEAQAQRALDRAEEETAFAQRLVAARREWTEAQGEVLAAGFAAALHALDATLSDRVARLIAPVLGLALQRQALDEFASATRKILAEPQHAAVIVRGPEDLIAVLSARLGGLSGGVRFEAAEGPEVALSSGETVIETELAAWSRLIAAAVAEA